MIKAFKKFIIVLICTPLALFVLFWIGTRNLSDTKGNPYVEIAEKNTHPNNDFTYSTNPSIERKACRNYPVSGSFHPFTCINTVTSFYNPKNTCSYCPDFVKNPAKWGFKEVKSKDRQPGDMIIFYRKGVASHAAMYVGESLFGSIMNHSDGGYLWIDYQRHVPYYLLTKFFWERVRYYRHN